ncbi:MAG: carboxypeptidase-like regulatory domain-containing protein [Bacteroidaceae bacterium]|nr:carboxypeptidase-like regulatory domain-containing protein [Bacteroidaceae bacterium]MBQ4003063.1 carboxypeptidase-like regulatory domain-containing protein [Bacteroidaceae bacterium]
MRTLLLFLLLAPLTLVAQEKWSARVVDAESGEPLPYVSIYVAQGRGTMSNEEGRFTLSIGADETAKFSCIGYKTLQLRSGAATVRMQPLSQELREVTITPIETEDILRRLAKQLRHESQKFATAEGRYFFRTTIIRQRRSEMMEGFMHINSAVNLNTMAVVAGKRYDTGKDDDRYFYTHRTNMHRLLELGPYVCYSKFWETSIIPLNSFKQLQKYYTYEATVMFDEDERRIYRIELRHNGKQPSRGRHRTVVQGTLYVDAETEQLLRFDGEVLGIFMSGLFVTDARKPTVLNIHALYDHQKGFTEVKSYFLEGENSALHFYARAFYVDKREGAGQIIDNNMVAAIKKAGDNPMLWEHYDVLQRVEAEEEICRMSYHE